MKLFTRYNRVNFVIIFLVLLCASAAYYLIIRHVMIAQLDDSLVVEEQEIMDHVKKDGSLPEATHYHDQAIQYLDTTATITRKLESVGLADPKTGDPSAFRRIVFPVTVQNRHYAVTVTKSQEEVDRLVQLTAAITAIIILLFLLIIFIFNRFLLRELWRPFYDILNALREFNLLHSSPRKVAVPDTDEFRDLDDAISQMKLRVGREYQALKNFTDSASHEMQTPLAIINSRLDVLIQDHNLQENQMKQLQGIYDAISRLTRLNQSLLLLTKIDNNQFDGSEENVLLQSLIDEKISQFEEIIAARHIRVHKNMQPVRLSINPYLADILIMNLLQNAVRHNIDKGTIDIILDKHQLVIGNTGEALAFNAEHIFDRFQKSDRSEGMGLGLAIVKQICDQYQIPVRYSYKEEMHLMSFQIDSRSSLATT